MPQCGSPEVRHWAHLAPVFAEKCKQLLQLCQVARHSRTCSTAVGLFFISLFLLKLAGSSDNTAQVPAEVATHRLPTLDESKTWQDLISRSSSDYTDSSRSFTEHMLAKSVSGFCPTSTDVGPTVRRDVMRQTGRRTSAVSPKAPQFTKNLGHRSWYPAINRGCQGRLSHYLCLHSTK
ncbi:hypothetical protein J6590_076368 [Homalodisca vitripennis]|nr:hypothetical protein J6590_076368 [Homalodisca vitripennis]